MNPMCRVSSTLVLPIPPLRCIMASLTEKLIGCPPVTLSCTLFPACIAVLRIPNHIGGDDCSFLIFTVALLFTGNNFPMNVQALKPVLP